MSVSLRVGLAGVSVRMSRVSPRTPASTAAGIRGVGEREVHPETGEDLPAQAQGPAEDHVGDDRVVARAQEREQDGVDRGHAGAERATVHAPFEGGELRLEGPHGGVVRARVGVALLPVAVDGRLHVGGRLVDGGEDRPGRRVRLDPGAHLPGREAVVRTVPAAHVTGPRPTASTAAPSAGARGLARPRGSRSPASRTGLRFRRTRGKAHRPVPAGPVHRPIRSPAGGGSPRGAPSRGRPRSPPPGGTRSRPTPRIPARR